MVCNFSIITDTNLTVKVIIIEIFLLKGNKNEHKNPQIDAAGVPCHADYRFFRDR